MVKTLSQHQNADVFRPRYEPARSIYDAFQDEAQHRSKRSLEDWRSNEIQAVYRVAVELAPQYGLAMPTLEDVDLAERIARGSVDYGSKWAHGLVNRMRRDGQDPVVRAALSSPEDR